MGIVNPELFALAKQALAAQAALFEKVSVVPPGGGMDPAAAAQGAVPPVDPAQAAMGAAPPPGGAPPAPAGGMMDPSMLGALPPAQPQAAAGPAQQKLKPEQMMQMLDYRLYNMQQQLTAIMNAMGVQVAPESLVLPPGTTGAPPAETALPGGPMAPPPQDPAAAQGGAPAAPPADPAAAGMPKQAEWWTNAEETSASRIGRPISKDLQSPEEPISLQLKAAAVTALRKNLQENAN
jgi:hypothetical protein